MIFNCNFEELSNYHFIFKSNFEDYSKLHFIFNSNFENNHLKPRHYELL